MSELRFSDDVATQGVRERRFDLDVDGHNVPGIIWTPDGEAETRPVVLIGHGGGGHKRLPYALSLARRLVRHLGYAAVCIDAPGHGDRADATGRGITDLDPEEATDRIRTAVDDWKVTLDSVQELEDVGQGPIGWWGLSMGTGIGVPVVAREPRIQVAVLGLMGLITDRIEAFRTLASRITVPVLFLVQLEDELFTRESQLALFDALGSNDKRLHANPGAHSDVPREEMDVSEAFLAKHLSPVTIGV